MLSDTCRADAGDPYIPFLDVDVPKAYPVSSLVPPTCSLIPVAISHFHLPGAVVETTPIQVLQMGSRNVVKGLSGEYAKNTRPRTLLCNSPQSRGWGFSSVSEHLLTKYKDLSSILSTPPQHPQKSPEAKSQTVQGKKAIPSPSWSSEKTHHCLLTGLPVSTSTSLKYLHAEVQVMIPKSE